MNLFNSLLTSFLIVAVLWGFALLQSDTVQALEVLPAPKSAQVESHIAPAPQTLTKQADTIGSLQIAGVSARIALDDIDALWQQFESADKLHKQLIAQPQKVYVYYRAFSDLYRQAEVTIGYDLKQLNNFIQPVDVNTKAMSKLLSAGEYSDSELAAAWTQIDFSTAPGFVLEVHQLNDAGESISTQLFVSRGK